MWLFQDETSHIEALFKTKMDDNKPGVKAPNTKLMVEFLKVKIENIVNQLIHSSTEF